MAYRLGTRSKENTWLLRPDLLAVLNRGLTYGVIDYGVPDNCARTQQEHDAMYEQGRTTAGDIVTWTRNSNHIIKPDGYSYAVDVVPYVNNKYTWDEIACLLMATVIFKAAAELNVHDLDWGYHLWKKDMPHFQVITPYKKPN